MARLIDDSAAIFSPSVARVAASNARDWSYVETWLLRKLAENALPTFERNPDTLKILLSLAAANEQADEQRDALYRAEFLALAKLREHADPGTGRTKRSNPEITSQAHLKEAIVTAIENDMPTESRMELETLVSTAHVLGDSASHSDNWALKIHELQTGTSTMVQMRERVDVLHRHMRNEIVNNEGLLQKTQTSSIQTSNNLSKQNLEIQRRTKASLAQLATLHDHPPAGVHAQIGSQPTIRDLAMHENELEALLSNKAGLDKQLGGFQSLPTDPDKARAELDDLRQQLHGITSRRDHVFEDMVERESPVRRR